MLLCYDLLSGGGFMLLVKNANYNGNGVDILSLDGNITMIKENIENYYGIENIQWNLGAYQTDLKDDIYSTSI